MYQDNQTNQAIILQIIKDNKGDCSYGFETLSEIHKTISLTKNHENLYLKIFPYLEFDTLYQMHQEIKKFSQLHADDNFKEIFTQFLITNKELFKDYRYEVLVFYKMAEERLDKDTFEMLNNSIFSTVNDNRLNTEIKMETVSYQMDKLSFFKKMDSNILESSGQFYLQEFIESLYYSKEIFQQLKIDRVIKYQIEDDSKIQLMIVNPKDKNTLDLFIKNLPDIFGSMLPYIKPSSSNEFSQNHHIIEKYIQHMMINDSLPEKETGKVNKNKI